jgi:predicted metalloendopeptidase
MRLAAFGLVLAGVAAAAPGPTPLKSGLDPASFDTSVRPQDDLFQYVNGAWIAKTDIPPDRVTYGVFDELTDQAEANVRTIIEDLIAKGPYKQGSSAQQIADLYRSMLDEDRTERLGLSPVLPELRKIDAIGNTRDFAIEAGYLASVAGGGPFGGSVGLDPRDPTRLVVQIAQGGTLLPDRDYYLGSEPRLVEIRRQYQTYLAQLLALAGRSHAEADAAAVLSLETDLARAEWPLADSRDPAKTYNWFDLGDLASKMPGFDWTAWAKPQGIDRAQGLVLAQPSFFKAFAAMVPATPLETWKAWLVTRHLTAQAPYLSRAFSDLRFDFFGRVLSGQEAVRVAWKRGVGLANSFAGDAVAKRYVQRYFSPAARARAEKLVSQIVEAYRLTIRDLDWMSAATRRGALEKLFTLATKVGYPDQWRDYTGFVVKADDLIGNLQRGRTFDNEYRMATVRLSADHGNWLITPQTVNAYYNPMLNEIVIPAAMLQPPLFDVDADDAVNYGAIGAVIGHEIGHAFDGLGRQFDASHHARDWWKPADEAEFRTRALRLVRQFDGYSPAAGLHVNGLLTLGENVGDLGGLSIAHRAYTLSLKGKPSPVIDGLTGDQRFFLGWAQIWRSKMRDEYIRQMVLAVPYAPPAFRANGPLSNLQEFYDAFEVKAGDKLYRAPGDRVKIW